MTRPATWRSRSRSTPDWADTPSGGATPELLVDLYVAMNQTNRECFVARFRYVPNFAGANEVYVEVGHMGPTGTIVASGGESGPFTVDAGTNGVFGPRLLSLILSRSDAAITAFERRREPTPGRSTGRCPAAGSACGPTMSKAAATWRCSPRGSPRSPAPTSPTT